ncbi:ubiquitin-domain-containing protein [Colletotrichum sp. SAR11_239]|nr:ubiquitin-domain-containing protein [Colletotrichum sp. SAR11_239]
MATRQPPAESLSTTRTISSIRVKTKDGERSVEYNEDDTIQDLKQRLEASLGHPLDAQKLNFSGESSGKPSLLWTY